MALVQMTYYIYQVPDGRTFSFVEGDGARDIVLGYPENAGAVLIGTEQHLTEDGQGEVGVVAGPSIISPPPLPPAGPFGKTISAGYSTPPPIGAGPFSVTTSEPPPVPDVPPGLRTAGHAPRWLRLGLLVIVAAVIWRKLT